MHSEGLITTTAAGRAWHFSHGLGRPTNEHNGKTGGYRYPVSLAVAPDDILFVLSRGTGWARGSGSLTDHGRIGKTTLDEEHLGDFARQDFTWPACIARAQDGNLYVSDEYENTISWYDPGAVQPYPEYDPNGEQLGKWGTKGSGVGQLDGPTGLAFDANDDFYVADSRNDRVQKFIKDGTFLLAWGSPGSADGQFSRPWGLTIDREGNVYVADWGNSRVQKFSADGVHLLTFGADRGTGAELDHPADVAVDSQGDVYVTDWGNRRVQIYDAGGDVLAALYGDAVELSKAGEYIMHRDPETIRAFRQVKDTRSMGRFQRPIGIEVDDQDRVIVTDACGRLQVYRKESTFVEPELKLELE